MKVKEEVKKAKQKSWEDFGNRMEIQGQGNSKLLYRTLKSLGKNQDSKEGHKFIKDKDGKLLTNQEKIKERWYEYFSDLLGDQANITKEHDMYYCRTSSNLEEDENITCEEVTKALNRLKNDKSAREDGIKSEMLKHMGQEGTRRRLYKLIVKVEKEE